MRWIVKRVGSSAALKKTDTKAGNQHPEEANSFSLIMQKKKLQKKYHRTSDYTEKPPYCSFL